MKHSIWESKIPTILGILFIVIGVFATSYLSQTTTIFQGRAGASQDPKNIHITNITGSSFTISYTTDTAVVGSLLVGKDINSKVTVLDDRDQQNKLASHLVHSITAKSLESSTKYFFSIVSGQTTYSKETTNTAQNDKEPQSFEVTTGPALSQPLTDKKIGGLLTLPSGVAPKEGIVYLRGGGTQWLSVLTSESGSYDFSIGTIRTSDLRVFADLAGQTFTLLATGDDLSSNVITTAGESKIPTITLSKDYDFTQSTFPVASFSATMGFPTLIATVSASNPSISTPKQNQQFTDAQPLFKGTALPGATVQVTIRSQSEIKAQVTADGLGNWVYRPANALEAGTHVITIQTLDKSGILKSITQSFTVFASGTQVGESATPSATPTFAPSLAPTRVPTLVPTATPTMVPSATPTPLVFPTKPKPPQSGDSSAIKGTVAGALSSFLGLLLLLITRGTIRL